MRRLIAFAALAIAACSVAPTSTPAVVRLDPSPSVTPVATPTPSAVPTVSTAPTATTAPTTPTATAGPRGRVDVINGPRPVVIQIQTGGLGGVTDLSAWAWEVPPGARLTLLDEPHARPAYIWILDVPGSKHSCGQLAYTTFSADPFTIVLTGPATGGDYRMTLKVGASLRGPVDTDYSPACSG